MTPSIIRKIHNKKSVYQVYAGVGINFVTVWEKGKEYTGLANCCCPQFWEFNRPPNAYLIGANAYQLILTPHWPSSPWERGDWTGLEPWKHYRTVPALCRQRSLIRLIPRGTASIRWSLALALLCLCLITTIFLRLFFHYYFDIFLFRLFTLSVKEVVRNRCKLSIPNDE